MASVIDICNLALGHLGDRATVASIDPPEGSAQAEHCTRFYAIARDNLLEMHPWGFATRRAQLAQLTSEWTEWDYTYARPADAIKILSILPAEATDDVTESYQAPYSDIYTSIEQRYTPRDYVLESNDDGAIVIRTDEEDAVCRYTARVEDPTEFSPLFVTTASWELASMLAGPILKGDAGAAEAKRCKQLVQFYLAQAQASDANQRRVRPSQIVPWINKR